MTKETIERLVKELAAEYENVSLALDGARVLVNIPAVHFPDGCSPLSGAALIVLDEAQPTPQLFLKVIPKLSNGNAPRSVSSSSFGGEAWYGFSFKQAWDENADTAVQFVEGRLRRFALQE